MDRPFCPRVEEVIFVKIIVPIFVLGIIVSATIEATVPVGKLVLYFPFEEGEGVNVNDASKSGNDGKIKGGAVWSQKGKYGNALEFNAKDSYVLVSTSSSLDIETEVTIMAWVKWLDAGDGWLCIMASGQQNGPWESYGMFINRGGKHLYFPLNLEGGFLFAGQNDTPGGAVVPEVWQHICGTYDGETAKIYIDGELIAEHEHGDDLASTGMDLRIGHRLGSNHFFNGLMDEVAIFEKALDKDEIQEAMSGLVMSVSPAGKLSTCWGFIKKSARHY
jgi:hypothetical protein